MKQCYPSKRFLYLLGGCCVLSILPIFFPAWGTAIAGGSTLFLLTATAADFLTTRQVTRDDVEVTVPDELGVGREGMLQIQITSNMEEPIRTQVVMTVADALSLDTSSWEFQLPPDEPIRLRSTIKARTRTRAKVGPLRLRHRGSFGLFVYNLHIPDAGEIDVIPDILDIRNEELQVHQIVDLITGRKKQEQRSQEGEFDSLMEYEPGMDPRKIDWKASARHYRMLSRKYRIEQNHNIYLTLDTGRLMGTRSDGIKKLDWAINSALRLAFLALNVGDRVGMMAFAKDIRKLIKPRKGLSQFQRLLEQMNELDSVEREPNFIRAFRMFSKKENERSLVVVFTDFVDRVSASLLMESLAHVRKRHVVLFVACQDIELQSTLLHTPEEMMDVHRQNEAFRLLKNRKQVIREIQRMNITAIDRDVSKVSTNVINQYLKLKSNRRL